MKKKLIFYFNNKINSISNFYNYLSQINIKISFFEINKSVNKYFKIIYFNDTFYKINQFIKLAKKCSNIINIKQFNTEKKFFFFNFLINKNIKFYKNFIFIIKKKIFFILFDIKKINYVLSILNNSIFTIKY